MDTPNEVLRVDLPGTRASTPKKLRKLKHQTYKTAYHHLDRGDYGIKSPTDLVYRAVIQRSFKNIVFAHTITENFYIVDLFLVLRGAGKDR